MLSGKKKKVVQAILNGRPVDDALLREFGVSARWLEALLAGPDFHMELANLLARRRRDYVLAVCRQVVDAVERLGQLIRSDKDETARRAASELIDRFLASAGSLGESDSSGGPVDAQAEQLARALERELAQERGKVEPDGAPVPAEVDRCAA